MQGTHGPIGAIRGIERVGASEGLGAATVLALEQMLLGHRAFRLIEGAEREMAMAIIGQALASKPVVAS